MSLPLGLVCAYLLGLLMLAYGGRRLCQRTLGESSAAALGWLAPGVVLSLTAALRLRNPALLALAALVLVLCWRFASASAAARQGRRHRPR